MPYVRRDPSGAIVAVSMLALEGFSEVAADADEIIAFEQQLASKRDRLRESDLDVVRVLDDLITLLIDKNAIRFTDLPEAAQHKLIQRRGLRRGGAHLGLLGDDGGIF